MQGLVMNAVNVVFPARATVAAAAPVICILHCLAAPVLAVVAPVLAENHLVELALMGTSLAMGLSLAHGGIRRHGNRWIWAPVVLALVLFTGSAAGLVEGFAEQLATVGGSLSVLAVLGWDARLRWSCNCRDCC